MEPRCSGRQTQGNQPFVPELPHRTPANHFTSAFGPFSSSIFLLGLLSTGETSAALHSLSRRNSKRLISLILQAFVWLTAEPCVSVVKKGSESSPLRRGGRVEEGLERILCTAIVEIVRKLR